MEQHVSRFTAPEEAKVRSSVPPLSNKGDNGKEQKGNRDRMRELESLIKAASACVTLAARCGELSPARPDCRQHTNLL